ncbi:MAG: hypothetical protein K0A95_02670 [Chromatiales bacterium]|nr:hypothetical protein [Gammaproteobacteria bacterium]MBW6475960.1 hypothetical protein [Chromatiales bacterium]
MKKAFHRRGAERILIQGEALFFMSVKGATVEEQARSIRYKQKYGLSFGD